MSSHRLLFFLSGVCIALAQAPSAPVIDSRGLINGFTKTPAPSTVARGGILHVNGLNLGPSVVVTASGLPLPTKLGNPEIQVLINGKAAPLFSVSSSRAVVQVPWEADLGLAQVVVTNGGVQSRTGRFTIAAEEPAVRTTADSGYGVAGTVSGQTLSLSASGLGPTNPSVDSGAAGPASPAVPAAAVTTYIGGIGADMSAALSTQRAGEFDVQVNVPVGARPGDVISLQVQTATGLRAANRTIFQGIRTPDLQYLKLPDGAPAFQNLTGSDLNGNFLVAAAARDAQGCYSAFTFDFVKKTSARLPDCLSSSNNAAPVVAPGEANVLGALIGPAPSSKAVILSPTIDAPISVNLPVPATALLQVNGKVAALTAGSSPQLLTIDPLTGEVGDAITFGGLAGAAAGPPTNLSAGGLTNILSAPTAVPQGLAVILGDDADKPARAAFAVFDTAGTVLQSRDFPDGWLPLLAPSQAAAGGAPGGGFPGGGVPPGGLPGGGAPPGGFPGGGAPGGAPPGGFPGGAGGPGGFAIGGARESTFYDADGGVLYALARAADNSQHGLIAFALDAAPTTIAFPAGYYAAACSTTIPFFSSAIARRVVVAASRTADIAVRTPCSSVGFVRLELSNRSMSFIALQGQGQLDASAGNVGEMNSYIYASGASADSLFVLDAVSEASFRLNVPAGINGFSGLRTVPAISALVGSATSRTTGDAGLALFDLGNQTVTVFPVPDGFASVSLLDVFTTTRKLVARGIKPGNAGAQFLIFDLDGNLTIVPNPDGVAFVGPVPAQTGGTPTGGTPTAAAQTMTTNRKANTVAALALDRDGKQVGVAVLRVP